MNAIALQPCRLWVCDEFGKILQAVLDKRGNQHLKNIGTHLLKLYGKSSGRYTGAAHSDKIRNAVDQPHLCVLGLTTGSTVFSAITHDDLTDGLLGRMAWWPVSERPDADYELVVEDPGQELIDKVMEGEAVLTGPVVPGYGNYPLAESELQQLYTVNVEKAKQLMAEAGFADGFQVTAMTFPGYANDNAVVVQEQLKQINIDMQIEQIEFGTFAKRVTNGEYDWCFTARGMRADVNGYVNDFRRLGIAKDNWFPAWQNAELEAAYDAGMATLDPAKRKEAFDTVQRLVIDESPHIYLYQDLRFSAVRKEVEGYYVAFTTFRPALRSTSVSE